MDESKKLKIGIIGCGVGILHLQGFAENPRAEVVAIAGLDQDRCRDLAKQFDVPRVYGEYQELIADPDIEAVTVAVPNILHVPVALAALEAGKHVMVEKPLAPTAAEGQRIIDAAREANRVLGVVFNRRGRQDVQLVKREVERGALGEIYHARAFWMRRSGIPGLGTWFTSKGMAGGGPLIDLGIHVLDMALWILGNPTARRVSAATYAELGPQGRGQWQGGRFKIVPGETYEVEDFATARLDLANDATMHLECSWRLHAGCEARIEAAFYGTEGGAIFRNINGSFYDFQAELFRGTKTEKLASPPDTWGGRAAAEWATRLASGARFDSTVDRLVQVAATLDSIYES